MAEETGSGAFTFANYAAAIRAIVHQGVFSRLALAGVPPLVGRVDKGREITESAALQENVIRGCY